MSIPQLSEECQALWRIAFDTPMCSPECVYQCGLTHGGLVPYSKCNRAQASFAASNAMKINGHQFKLDSDSP